MLVHGVILWKEPLPPEEFLLVVVLVSFLRVPGWGEAGLDVLDLFSGKARISKLGSWMKYKCRAFDLNYHPVRYPGKRKRGKFLRSCMDMNGSAGFVFLD